MAKRIHKKVTKYNLPIIIEPCEEGGYFTRCPVFQGCFVESETIPQAIEYIEDVIHLFIESYKELGDPLPDEIRCYELENQKVEIPVNMFLPVELAV